jgi:hypothetical protein
VENLEKLPVREIILEIVNPIALNLALPHSRSRKNPKHGKKREISLTPPLLGGEGGRMRIGILRSHPKSLPVLNIPQKSLPSAGKNNLYKPFPAIPLPIPTSIEKRRLLNHRRKVRGYNLERYLKRVKFMMPIIG